MLKQKIKKELEWFETHFEGIAFWLAIAVILIMICSLIQPVHADMVPPDPTPNVTPTVEVTTVPTTYVPYVTYITPRPTYTPLPTPITTVAVPMVNTTINRTAIKRLEQGDSVCIGSTYDISGVIGWSTHLAWYNNYEFEPGVTPYTLELPDRKSGYYNFYIDPDIFSTMTGDWYQYYGVFEGAGNLHAFTVLPYCSPWDVNVNLTENETIADKQVEELKPPVPARHVADYLIARGDGFNISVNGTSTLWLFGVNSGLYDYRSINGTINVNKTFMNSLEPGSYKLVIQSVGSGTQDLTMRYNPDKYALEWFDFKNFHVDEKIVAGYSPQVLYDVINDVRPQVLDQFTDYTFELQEPMVSISQINPKDRVNRSTWESGYEYNRTESYLDIMGYTNVAPGTPIKFIIDKDKQTVRTINSSTITNFASGKFGGDMRWFHAIVPVDKYNAGRGEHFVTVTTPLGGETTVPYYIYELPPDSYVPDKTIRYIAGRTGDTEFVPTPTPEIVKVVETQKVYVTRTIMVPVTPSEEVVKKAQRDAVLDTTLTIGKWLFGIAIIAVAIGYIGFVISRGRKVKKE